MGAHAIHLALGLYLLIVHAFGNGVEWFGSGPLDPVVVRLDGELVAVVMPCKGPDADEHERGTNAACALRQSLDKAKVPS
jgi:hypothetical protein